jgi:DNA end-binding protein Ku
MPRAIWTGSLSFGLVNVPVGLFTATDDKTVHFNQFQSGTSDRIRLKRVNERTGDDVDYEELESVEPGRSRTIEIRDFVDLDDIDPIYYKSTYYVGPQGEQAARPYALLHRAMATSKKVAIGSLVLRTKEHLVAIRPMDKVLALETMAFADEIRDPSEELRDVPAHEKFAPRELETAKLLIESMATAWDPALYHDEYRERVEALIEDKRKGKVVVVERPEAAPTPVVNLMEALQASVEAARRHRPGTRVDLGPATKATKAGKNSASSKPRRAAVSAPSEDLSTLTKADLMARAADLGVEGRSKMTRPELVRALERAAKPARRRKAS